MLSNEATIRPEVDDATGRPLVRFEFYGEASPALTATAASATPAAYEYTWTLSRTGAKPRSRREEKRDPLWGQLRKDVAARIYVFFPSLAGWRIQEVAAAVKYLSPTRHRTTVLSHVENLAHWTAPVLGDAAAVAKLVPGGNVAANWLDVASKLHVQSVPPSNEFPWTVEKVTRGWDTQHPHPRDGVLFTLPRSMFELLGGQITGTIAVVFHQTKETIEPAKVEAHAALYFDNKADLLLPASNGFLGFNVQPAPDGGAQVPS